MKLLYIVRNKEILYKIGYAEFMPEGHIESEYI